MTIFYFRSLSGVHKFAHGPIHRKGWDWWSRNGKEHPEISICHEVYEADAGRWENVYLNYRPMGLGTYIFFSSFFRFFVLPFSDSDVSYSKNPFADFTVQRASGVDVNVLPYL
jgi:hypothetical protein